jgi:hypothetical protein
MQCPSNYRDIGASRSIEESKVYVEGQLCENEYERAPLRFLCSALTTWATESSFQGLTTSSCKYIVGDASIWYG